MPPKKKEFKPTYSAKVKNANLYADIVSAGGDKRVAALAARAHPNMNPKANPYYVQKKANQAFNDQTKKTKNPKPKRALKTSPHSRRTRKARK